MLYPPNLIQLLLPAPLGFHLLLTLHLGLAAFGMYRLARSLPVRRPAAILGALCYALSFTLCARVAAGHYLPLATISHAPLLIYLVRRSMQRPRWDRALLLGAYGGMVLLYNHPQFLIHLALLTAAFAGIEILRLRRKRRAVSGALGSLAGALAAALLIAAPLLLPSFEVRPHSIRGTMPLKAIYPEVPPDYSFLPRDGISYLVPLLPRAHYVQGEAWVGFWHEKAVYIGILPLACALYAVLSKPRRFWCLFLGGLVVVALLEGAARHVPLHRFSERWIPGLGAFRVPCRSVWMATFGLCLLAALGWDRWTSNGGPALLRRWFPRGIAISGVLFAVLLGYRFHGLRECILLAGIAGATAIVLFLSASGRAQAAVAAGILTLLDLGGQAWSVIPAIPVGARSAAPWYLSALGDHPSEYRVLETTHETDYRSAVHDVRMADGYGHPLLTRTQQFYSSAWDPPVPVDINRLGAGRSIRHPRTLDVLNVGWLVWEGELPEPGLIETARSGSLVLYRRPSARPRVFMDSGPVSFTWRQNSLDATVSHDRTEALVVSESWMPGWQAEIDGRPAEVGKWEEALVAVTVPPGDHQVRLRYSPPLLRLGLWVSATILGASLSLLASRLLARRLGRRTPLPVIRNS